MHRNEQPAEKIARFADYRAPLEAIQTKKNDSQTQEIISQLKELQNSATIAPLIQRKKWK